MQFIFGLTPLPIDCRPIAMTIGNFDGVHRGHGALLQQLCQCARRSSGRVMAVTFENHPSEVLADRCPVGTLTTFEHKLNLLVECGVDIVLTLRFTEEISQLTAEQFLSQIQHLYPYDHLFLGSTAVLGKHRTGTAEEIGRIAKKRRFSLHYLPQFCVEGEAVSSSLIRAKLVSGDLSAVAKLLGREYSICAEVVSGQQLGKRIGFPTANIDVSGLCLPPYGVYAVRVKYRGEQFAAIANLGVAPTMRDSIRPRLEVYLLERKLDLYNCEIEVIFVAFIREEKKFLTVDALREQIACDIVSAKAFV